MDSEYLDENSPLLQNGRPVAKNTPSSPYQPSTEREHHCKNADVLPLVPQVTLGLLGLWSPRRRTTSSRAALKKERISCTEDISLMKLDKKQMKGLDDESSPHILDDNENMREDIDDEEDDVDDVREGDKSCLISDVFAIIYLLTTCSLLTYNFVTYLKFYWGKKQHLLHLVSYFTFLFQVMAIPFWCFYARILCIVKGHRYRQDYPLFRSFLSSRVAVLSNSRFGAKGLSWCRLIFFLVWPMVNAILRIANDYMYTSCDRKNETSYRDITHWGAFVGYVLYGCFCYLVHIEHTSFECEVLQISGFARKQASQNNIDATRSRISQFYLQYNVLRRLIRNWMAFTMVVATWGLTAHLTWNYLVFSSNDIHPENQQSLQFLNLLISSQKIMFFVVPCVAIGGLNLEHVWKRLKYDIARNYEYAHEAYWSAINRYMYQINVDHAGDLTPTLIFSAIGFYLGLNLGQGDQEWKFYYQCNASYPLH